MNFINTRKRTDEEGIYWTLADAAAGKPSYYDEICMYAGASGIICFLLSLYEDTQDAAYLDEAKEAGCYLEYRWRKRRELKRNFSPYAFSTGWGGASFALLLMYLVTKDEHYRTLVEEILDRRFGMQSRSKKARAITGPHIRASSEPREPFSLS